MTRWLTVGLPAVLLIALLVPQATLASSVTPVKYGRWRQDQVVPFIWKADAKPPAWLKAAILAAADDSASSRGSRAAVFEHAESANSWIGYMEDVCAEAAIGCAWNNAPSSFSLRIRPQGWVFDWGTLRWCLLCLVSPIATRAPSELGPVNDHSPAHAPSTRFVTDQISRLSAEYDGQSLPASGGSRLGRVAR
jgi:hypothetical protein